MELLSEIFYYPFINLLTFLIWASPGHYAAVGIIVLTLIVRFILLVPSKKAAQSQRRIAQLQPLMDEIKKEHGSDKTALAAAQMELYKKNNINPFSSCVFILIQFPILYILYYTFLHGLAPHSPHLYSWVPSPEFINPEFFGINLFAHDKYYILPALAALLQFFQTRLTLPVVAKDATSIDPQVAIQRNMTFIIPVITLVVARTLPAGVALYWVVSTLFSVIQQVLVNRERLSLQGVDKIVAAEEKAHPEFIPALEKAKKEVLGTETKKGGVEVTVRRKKK